MGNLQKITVGKIAHFINIVDFPVIFLAYSLIAALQTDASIENIFCVILE